VVLAADAGATTNVPAASASADAMANLRIQDLTRGVCDTVILLFE
jgi:hypothetical protein